jgi:hypothetical protein
MIAQLIRAAGNVPVLKTHGRMCPLRMDSNDERCAAFPPASDQSYSSEKVDLMSLDTAVARPQLEVMTRTYTMGTHHQIQIRSGENQRLAIPLNEEEPNQT